MSYWHGGQRRGSNQYEPCGTVAVLDCRGEGKRAGIKKEIQVSKLGSCLSWRVGLKE